ncbi:hypothetical protein, partial [Rhodoblastus sp.]|uniref:hypothetical protein n=1 Tax=Rhodoblastus sp. TaxID=1962975 RepID=UPI003FD8FC88
MMRFPQDCFAIRGNAMARKSSTPQADFRASGIRIPNDSFGIRMTPYAFRRPPCVRLVEIATQVGPV